MHWALVLLIWVFCFYCLLVCLYSAYISIWFKTEVSGASFGHHYTAKVTPHPLPSPRYWTYFSLEYWHFHAWFSTRATSYSTTEGFWRFCFQIQRMLFLLSTAVPLLDLSKACVVLKHASHRPSCVYRSIWPDAWTHQKLQKWSLF